MKPDIPESTDEDWKFYAFVDGLEDTNLVASAWMWEYLREALTNRPDCLDWHWNWRSLNQERIEKALSGDLEAIRYLREDSGHECWLSTWMISPRFPATSISEYDTWKHFCYLAEILPPCAGSDEPNQWQLRRPFFPLENDEAFPIMGTDDFIESMRVIHRSGHEVILPISIDLGHSDEFLKESFCSLLSEIRQEFEARFGPVATSNTRGKNRELLRKRNALKALAAKRLIKSANPEKVDPERAFNLASQHSLFFFEKSSHSAWYRARKEANSIAEALADKLGTQNHDQLFLSNSFTEFWILLAEEEKNPQ